MLDPSLPPANIQNFLTLKWRGNSQQTVSTVPDEYEPFSEVKTSPRKLKHQKWNSEPPTLGYLDTMEEFDSINATVKTIKGILKAPKKSRVLRSNPECETTTRNHTSPSDQLSASSQQTEQETPSNSENLDGSKSKKVTFSAETKKAKIKRNPKPVRLVTKTVQNKSDPDNLQVEDSQSNNLAPRSPRYVVKIVKKTSDPGKSPRYPSNSNILPNQSNDVNNPEDNLKDIFNIPCFEKSVSSDTPIQAYSSLQTMLDESPIYPTNYLPQIGSFSARNAMVQTSWYTNFHDRRSSGSVTLREDQFLLKVKKEQNLDYYAELQKKAPLIFQNKPSTSRPSSKIRARSDMFVIQKRDFIRPVMNSHERP